MGQYYNVVCHECKVRYVPELLKKREILLNQSISAQVGRFLVTHNHHAVELLGDEGDTGGCRHDGRKYRKITIADIDTGE